MVKHTKNLDFSTTILVPQFKAEVFKAIVSVKDWWDKGIVGTTNKLNGTFIHKAGSVHTCKLKIIEFKPDERVVWLVLENYFSFTENSHEWEGSRIEFDISKTNFKTQLRFTHVGLTPDLECFEHCAAEWTDYIQRRLARLISKNKMQSVSKQDSKKNNINH